jgi:hypothetical protein
MASFDHKVGYHPQAQAVIVYCTASLNCDARAMGREYADWIPASGCIDAPDWIPHGSCRRWHGVSTFSPDLYIARA